MPPDLTSVWKAIVNALAKRDPQHLVVISIFLGFVTVATISQSGLVTLISGAVAAFFLITYLKWSVGEARIKEGLAENALRRSEASAAEKRERQRAKASRLPVKPQRKSLTAPVPDVQPALLPLDPKQPKATLRAHKPCQNEEESTE